MISIEGKSRLVTPSDNGNVEQVGDACVFQSLKGKCACVHDGGQAQNRSHEMRHDARCTPKCREHACFPTLGETGGYGIDDSRAWDEDHNERCDQELKAEHLATLLRSIGSVIVAPNEPVEKPLGKIVSFCRRNSPGVGPSQHAESAE
jgi:hypothetical protein